MILIENRQRIIDEQRPALRHNRTPQEGGVFSVLAITENEVIPRYTNLTQIPDGPPTIIFNAEVVNRIKSLPYVQQVIPEYQGQLQLNAMGNIENAQVMGMDPTKLTS